MIFTKIRIQIKIITNIKYISQHIIMQLSRASNIGLKTAILMSRVLHFLKRAVYNDG